MTQGRKAGWNMCSKGVRKGALRSACSYASHGVSCPSEPLIEASGPRTVCEQASIPCDFASRVSAKIERHVVTQYTGLTCGFTRLEEIKSPRVPERGKRDYSERVYVAETGYTG